MDLKPAIFIGADHAGFNLKEPVKAYLVKAGYQVTDMGNEEFNLDDDYPDFGYAVAKNVAAILNSLGLLFCGSAQGMCMCANKVKGVRAALGWSPLTAWSSRQHNDANVLCLPGQHLAKEQAIVIVDTWLATPFSQGERHLRRLAQLAANEDREFRSF